MHVHLRSLLAILALVVAVTKAQNYISEIDLFVPESDRQCDMTYPAGTISLKICGSNCCFADHLGNFYYENAIFQFTGSDIGECASFDIGAMNKGEVSMTLFHFGTDGFCMSYARAFIVGGRFLDCNFNDTYVDNSDFIHSKNCVFV